MEYLSRAVTYPPMTLHEHVKLKLVGRELLSRGRTKNIENSPVEGLERAYEGEKGKWRGKDAGSLPAIARSATAGSLSGESKAD